MTGPSQPQPDNPPPDAGRKRTVAITLLALGAGAVTIGMFAGVGSHSGTRTFRNVGACEAENKDKTVDCNATYSDALRSHERNAPSFANREACEKEYGAASCVQPSSASGRGSVFIPAMAAFMIAQRAGGGFQAAPLYRRPGDPPDEYRQSAAFPFSTSNSTSNNYRSSSFNSGYWGSSSSSSQTRTTTGASSGSTSSATSVSRGGFGSAGFSSSGS